MQVTHDAKRTTSTRRMISPLSCVLASGSAGSLAPHLGQARAVSSTGISHPRQGFSDRMGLLRQIVLRPPACCRISRRPSRFRQAAGGGRLRAGPSPPHPREATSPGTQGTAPRSRQPSSSLTGPDGRWPARGGLWCLAHSLLSGRTPRAAP